ncbi:MAG: tRNA (guanosine(46)-N7)-methyltransferase TrmB [Bacteroidia bacterium]
MTNILEFPRHLKGKWHEHFGNENPIVLELACGKGHYTVGMGKNDKTKNFIGIDIKGARLWKGGTDATENDLDHVRFARFRIEFIDEVFAAGEVDEIWITFPDPQPKKAKNRLTHPFFLDKYKQVLKPNGNVHLKTDNTYLFEFTVGVLAGMRIEPEKLTRNLYDSKLYEDETLQIKTHYEALFVGEGEKIKYLKFKV